MDNMAYVFAAYSVIWLVFFGYLVTLYRKQHKLQREIEHLKALADQQED